MGKGQLLLQPGAVLAAGTLRVSRDIVPAVGSAEGWAGSWPVLVPSLPGAVSAWPVLRLFSNNTVRCCQVDPGAGTSEAAAGPVCTGTRTGAARSAAISTCTVVIRAPS